jgi:hypothetical protein
MALLIVCSEKVWHSRPQFRTRHTPYLGLGLSGRWWEHIGLNKRRCRPLGSRIAPNRPKAPRLSSRGAARRFSEQAYDVTFYGELPTFKSLFTIFDLTLSPLASILASKSTL